jgi:hypothetical protein
MRYLVILSDMSRPDSFVDHAASQLLQTCDSSKQKNNMRKNRTRVEDMDMISVTQRLLLLINCRYYSTLVTTGSFEDRGKLLSIHPSYF